MKICFLAPANNYHTKKWCKWFSEHNHEVHVVSFIDAEIENATVHYVNTGATAESGDSQKIKYLFKARKVKKIVDRINPDIVNAHYATSYGTVAALSGIEDYILSVWGSDIYDFPKKSVIHKLMLKYSLYKAAYIFSTSNAMAIETRKYTKKKIEITPFGVDMNLFNPNKRVRVNENGKKPEFIVGTVKGLTSKYGIDYLIKAVAIIKKTRPEIPIKLRIAGKGEKEEEYKQLAVKLGIADVTTWLGFISQEEAAREWANMDVAVVASTLESESFGVSAVEAEACGTAVIISDVPGLMEATKPEITSLVVRKCREYDLAEKIIKLYEDEEYRKRIGMEGRIFVEDMYEINYCFEKIEKLLKKISNQKL